MKTPGTRLWPFSVPAALLASVLILLGLIVALAVVRDVFYWPSPSSEKVVLIGALILGLIPLLLALIDVIVEHRAVVEIGIAKFDFSRVGVAAAATVSVPVNIGVPGRAVSESDTIEILDALRKAAESDVVVVDLEAGGAWWETRLLVLLSGAVRLRRPSTVVFVATDGGVSGRFQGWSTPEVLFPQLLDANSQYRVSYATARAAAAQWALVEPLPSLGPSQPLPQPPALPWFQPFASSVARIAFDPATGLPNELAQEQMLALDLGQKIESVDPPRAISIVRLQELFRPVLYTDQIDQTWSPERQLQAFFEGSTTFVAITSGGRYERLMPRSVALSGVVKALVPVA